MRNFLSIFCMMAAVLSTRSESATVMNDPSPAAPLKSQMIPVADGIQLHTLQQGSGPLILMLHGFPSYGGSWKPYMNRLSDRFNVVAPDLRGYNLSSQPKEVDAYRLELLMDDVRNLVTKLGETKVCLVGHDWGGLLSWYLAANYPETFQKLVIINGPHPKVYQNLYENDAEQKIKALYVPALMAPFSEKVLAFNDYSALQLMLFSGANYKFSEAEKEEAKSAWRKGLLGPVNYYRSYIGRQKQLSSDMQNIDVPTLVLWGEKDAALPAKNLDGLDRYVSDLEIVRYADGSHWVIYEKVPEISEEIARFCGE